MSTQRTGSCWADIAGFRRTMNIYGPAVATDWKRSILIPIPKKGSTKECLNHPAVALISHANKVMLKILHAGLQHYMN